MPDYNAGRATGTFEIGYDGRGLHEAQADMAKAAAEAAALDAAMGRVNRSFDDNKRKTAASAEEIVKARGEVDLLRREYLRYQSDYERGQQRVNEATQRARDVLRDQRTDLDAVREAHNHLNQAEGEAERLRSRAVESYEKYHAKLTAVRLEVDRFNKAHVDATSGFRNMAREAEKMGEALESVTQKLSSIARILGQAGLIGLFGGAAGGSLFATAAGGLNLLAGAASVVVEAIHDLVGVMALAPAAIQGAVLAFGSLALSLHGVGAALQSIGDPKKFIESIRDLSPTMQQVMLTVQSFTGAMRGARDAMQESFAQQFVQDIQPLITTWLPKLFQAGQQISVQWGQAFHQVFSFFQTPAAQQGFQTFVTNLVNGFQAARGAIQPLLTAWNTLATVGSSVFPRLGQAITVVATEFSNWIEKSAKSGQLLDFINRTLDSITNMGRVVRDVAIGLNNMFEIFRGGGGGTVQTLAQMSAEFRSWTESLGGQQSIANFFNLIKAAANALKPELHLLGEGLAIVASTLTRLGIAVGPGLTSFFTSFVEALRNLSPYVTQLAPAINTFLDAFGHTLLQIVSTLGPRLPGFFQDMSQAFVQIMQVLPGVVNIFAKLLDYLTPGTVETILSLVVAFKALSATTAVLNVIMDANPFVLVAAGIAAVVAGAILLATHWETVKQKVGEVTTKFGGLHGILETLKQAWDEATNSVGKFFSNLGGQIAGGWDVLVNGLSSLTDNIVSWFDKIDWASIGSNIVNGILNGITSMFGLAGDVASELMKIIKKPIPQSRAEVGPFSNASPEEMGTRMVTQYAAGMLAGRPSVDSAASSVAGSASGIGTGGGGAGFGSQSFTSGGISGKSGQDFTQGHSGFDQWINFITKDLTAWNNIGQHAFHLVESVSKIVTDTIKVAASVWGGGNNPLTQPGGIAGPPLPGGRQQQQLFGVPFKQIPGKAPIPALAPLGGPPLSQQQLPDVPFKPIPGIPSTGLIGGAGSPTGTPPANPPASTTGAAAPSSVAGPGGYTPDQLAQSIITQGQAAGMNPDQIQAALGVALQETGLGTNPRTNVVQNQNGTPGITGPFQQDTGYAKYGDRQNPDVAARGFIDQFVRTGQGLNNPNPWDQALQVQRPARVGAGGYDDRGTAASGSYLRGRQGGAAADIYNRLVGGGAPATPATTTGAATGAQGGVIPGAGVNPATQANFPLSGTTTDAFKASGDTNPPLYAPGSDTGGYGGPGQNVLPDWVKKFADKFGLVASTYPEGGTLHQAGYAFDFVPKPGNQDPAGSMDAFASFIQQNLTPQTLELIHFNERTGQKWGIAGAKDVAGTGYYESPDAFSEHGDFSSGAHVHWATDVPPILPGINAPEAPSTGDTAAAASGLPTTPRGPGETTPGGFHLPSDTSTFAIAGGAALATGGGLATVAILRRMGSAARTAYLRRNFNKYDARAKADVLRSLSPQDRAAIGSDPNIRFGTQGVPDVNAGPLNVDLGPAPGSLFDTNPATRPLLTGETRDPSAFSRLSPEYQRVLGRGLQQDIQSPFDQATRPISVLPANPPSSVTGDDLFGRVAYDPSNAIARPTDPWVWQNQGPRFTRQPASTTGADPASVVGDAGRVGLGSRLLGGLRTAGGLLALSGPGLSPDVQQVDAQGRPVDAQGRSLGTPAHQLGQELAGYGRALASGATLTGQESTRTPGVIYGPNGQVISAGPRAPTAGPGLIGGGAAGPRVTPPPAGASLFGAALGSTPVHVTNPQQLPGGTQSPGVKPATAEGPLKPGDKGFVGPVGPTTTQPALGGPPGAQAERRGLGERQVGDAAGAPGLDPGAKVGSGAASGQKISRDTRSPLDKFQDALGSVSSIAGDAFTVFQDYIESIGAAANITHTLVRGFANTEDVVGFIQQFQTFIKTGADIAKLVGDVGGVASAIGGASGQPGAGAPGAMVQAVAGIVQGALEATNEAISLGIEIYHEVGKYAGFIFGSFLGGANTGPLGGNVRMLLNTRTNQLQTYSEDNPLNKNTFEVPQWQRSYQQQATPPSLPPQVNIYAGPGQSPSAMMQESMWLASTGAPAVASVAGQD